MSVCFWVPLSSPVNTDIELWWAGSGSVSGASRTVNWTPVAQTELCLNSSPFHSFCWLYLICLFIGCYALVSSVVSLMYYSSGSVLSLLWLAVHHPLWTSVLYLFLRQTLFHVSEDCPDQFGHVSVRVRTSWFLNKRSPTNTRRGRQPVSRARNLGTAPKILNPQETLFLLFSCFQGGFRLYKRYEYYSFRAFI